MYGLTTPRDRATPADALKHPWILEGSECKSPPSELTSPEATDTQNPATTSYSTSSDYTSSSSASSSLVADGQWEYFSPPKPSSDYTSSFTNGQEISIDSLINL